MEIPISISSFAFVLSLFNNLICKYVVISTSSASNAYILIYITLLIEANVIDAKNAKTIDLIFAYSSSLNNSFNIKYINIVTNKYTIIFNTKPGQGV